MESRQDRSRERASHQAEARVDDFFNEISASGAVPPGTGAPEAAAAVLCTLFRRVAAGEARDFAESMPPTFRRLLMPCGRHRHEHAEVFDREEFLARVGEHFEVPPADAERLSQAVFAAVRRWMPQSQADDVESQLPPDLKELWRPGGGRRVA